MRGGDHFEAGAEHRAAGAATAAETAKFQIGCHGHRALETNFSRRMPAQKYPDRSVETRSHPKNARAEKLDMSYATADPLETAEVAAKYCM